MKLESLHHQCLEELKQFFFFNWSCLTLTGSKKIFNPLRIWFSDSYKYVSFLMKYFHFYQQIVFLKYLYSKSIFFHSVTFHNGSQMIKISTNNKVHDHIFVLFTGSPCITYLKKFSLPRLSNSYFCFLFIFFLSLFFIISIASRFHFSFIYFFIFWNSSISFL